jgi:hypothetical protein
MLFKKKLQVVKNEKEQPKKERKPVMATDTNSKFIYQSGADCVKIWKRYGYVPPSEHRTDYEFGKNREKDLQVKESHE